MTGLKFRVLATSATTALVLSGCDLFNGEDDAAPDAASPTAAAAVADGDDAGSDASEPELDLNLPDRPLSETQIRIGLDVYTTNEWEPVRCQFEDGGMQFDADLIGPDHDTRVLWGEIGVEGRADSVAVGPVDYDEDWSVWGIQGVDSEGYSAGTFDTLEADLDAGVIRGTGQFEDVVEHMRPASDPSTFADAEFVITCG